MNVRRCRVCGAVNDVTHIERQAYVYCHDCGARQRVEEMNAAPSTEENEMAPYADEEADRLAELQEMEEGALLEHDALAEEEDLYATALDAEDPAMLALRINGDNWRRCPACGEVNNIRGFALADHVYYICPACKEDYPTTRMAAAPSRVDEDEPLSTADATALTTALADAEGFWSRLGAFQAETAGPAPERLDLSGIQRPTHVAAHEDEELMLCYLRRACSRAEAGAVRLAMHYIACAQVEADIHATEAGRRHLREVFGYVLAVARRAQAHLGDRLDAAKSVMESWDVAQGLAYLERDRDMLA